MNRVIVVALLMFAVILSYLLSLLTGFYIYEFNLLVSICAVLIIYILGSINSRFLIFVGTISLKVYLV